ncbi:MAG TPA: sigma-70 family RNA polymerase sigma factor [Cytophagaceae bacterium]|jgi:RNA polymerase sigma-70 factor (ECF subfamily)
MNVPKSGIKEISKDKTLTNMEERELVLLCQNGDRRAMERLYNKYASKMRALCLRYSKTSFEVEDIIQEGFIKIFTQIKGFNFQGSFEGWIKRIVINTAINSYWKDKNLNMHVHLDAVDEKGLEPLEIAEQLSIEELYKIINQLPEGYKFVFNMYAIDGYSHKEIAEMLKITESSSRSQYTRARQSLIKLLKE